MRFSTLKPWSAGVQRWLRGDFPARELAPEFDLVVPSSQFGKPRHNLLSFARACSGLRARHVALLREIAAHLAALNRCPVLTATRWAHVAVAEYFARPAIRAIYAAYSPRDENPEPAERKESAQLAIEAVQQLAVAYELVLQSLQRLSGRTYALFHHGVLAIGHRLMELLQAEQHLCALRRMKLPERSWRNCNQLFFALRECEDVQHKLKLAGYLAGPERAAWLPKSHDEIPDHASVQQLYIAVQVTGMIEPASWAPRQFAWIQAYLRRTLPRLRVRSYVADGVDETSAVIVRTQNRAPSFGACDSHQRAALLLDVGPLARRVQRDLDRLSAGQQDTIFKRLVNAVGVGALEQAQWLEHLLRRLQFHAERDERRYVNQYVDLSLHWGFPEVFDHLKEDTRDDAWLLDDVPLTHQLARRNAALVASTTEQPKDKQWYLVNESAGGMQFRFQETRYTRPLFVGQLVALSRHGVDGAASLPQLGYVGRMQRGRTGEIEVAVQKLANETECVGVQDSSMKQSGHALPGILVHCLDGKWRLLLHSRHASYTLSKLVMRMDGHEQPLELGRMFLYQPEFVVFDLPGFERA
jgi:hypothetical protein